MTLSEVAAPEVVELDLSGNDKITSLAAVGAAVGGGALAALQATRTAACIALHCIAWHSIA